jgi:hypothetical protein
MNYKIKSLLFIFTIFTYLALYQNCGGGMHPITPPSTGSTTKLSVDFNRLKVGDIALEKSRISQQSQTQQQTTTITSIISGGGGSGSSTNTNYSDISYYQIKPWPNAELVYKFDISLTSREKDLFKSACSTWEEESGGLLKCVSFGSEESSTASYLLVSFSTSSTLDCYTDLGVASGVNKMVLTEGCTSSNKVLHLVGHAFGFIDQQLRPDRNEYVKVPTSGVEASYFLQFKGINQNLPAYDFASIMNHPFDGAYQPITGKIPQDISATAVGNLAKISDGDKAFAAKIYSSVVTGGTSSGDGSCSSEQLVTWGFGCYYHVPSYNPAKAAGTVLPSFNNQNTAYETSSKSSAQVKCVDGGWQLQSAQCANLPGVTTGTSDQGCAQATLQWSGVGANSKCYLANSLSLPESSTIGSIFEVATQQYGQPVGFGIFVCEKDAANVVKWTFKSSLTYKHGGEKYSHTKNSFCYSKQDEIDQCPSGLPFSWKSISGNTCSGALPNALTVGSKYAVMATSGTWGWARVTCIKEVTTTGYKYKIFADTSEGQDMGYCGHLADGNPAAIDLSDGKIVKLARCLPIQKLMTWKDNYNGEECSASVTINNTFFEGQPFIYQNILEANSFNSMVTLKCQKDASGVGQWVTTTSSEINATSGFLPAPICKKACLPPTQLSWTSTDNTYTCWGKPDQQRKLIENETTTLKATNYDATPDSQAEYMCSANGMLNKTLNSSNKCAH